MEALFRVPTKEEREVKKEIIEILHQYNLSEFISYINKFTIFITDDARITAYMIPDQYIIMLNKYIDKSQIHVVVIHEMLHQALKHGERFEKFCKEHNVEPTDELKKISNLCGDFEISNRGYTWKFKKIARSLEIRDKKVKGLVTDLDWPEMKKSVYEDMMEAFLKMKEEDRKNMLKNYFPDGGDKQQGGESGNDTQDGSGGSSGGQGGQNTLEDPQGSSSGDQQGDSEGPSGGESGSDSSQSGSDGGDSGPEGSDSEPEGNGSGSEGSSSESSSNKNSGQGRSQSSSQSGSKDNDYTGDGTWYEDFDMGDSSDPISVRQAVQAELNKHDCKIAKAKIRKLIHDLKEKLKTLDPNSEEAKEIQEKINKAEEALKKLEEAGTLNDDLKKEIPDEIFTDIDKAKELQKELDSVANIIDDQEELGKMLEATYKKVADINRQYEVSQIKAKRALMSNPTGLDAFNAAINKFVKDVTDDDNDDGETEYSYSKFNAQAYDQKIIKQGHYDLPGVNIPLVYAYFDESGSCQPQEFRRLTQGAVDKLQGLHNQGKIVFRKRYFGNDDEELTEEPDNTLHGGNTGAKKINEDILENRPQNVVIFTDTDIHNMANITVPGYVWKVFWGRTNTQVDDALKGRKGDRVFNITSGGN